MAKGKNYKPLIYLAIVLFLFYGSSIFILIPIALFRIDVNNCSDLVFNSLRLFYYAVTALILFFIYRKDIIKDFKNFKKNFGNFTDTAFKYWIVGFIIMIVSNILIGFFSPVNKANNEESVRAIIYSTPVIAFFLTSVCAPFIEEIVFRKAFKDAISSKWLFILTSGIVFGALHVIGAIESPYDFLYIIPYSALGIAFANIYHETNNIFSTIFMHAFHNALVLTLVLTGVGG